MLCNVRKAKYFSSMKMKHNYFFSPVILIEKFKEKFVELRSKVGNFIVNMEKGVCLFISRVRSAQSEQIVFVLYE